MRTIAAIIFIITAACSNGDPDLFNTGGEGGQGGEGGFNEALPLRRPARYRRICVSRLCGGSLPHGPECGAPFTASLPGSLDLLRKAGERRSSGRTDPLFVQGGGGNGRENLDTHFPKEAVL